MGLSHGLFFAFLVALAVQRVLELQLSRRNEQEMQKRGGQEHAPGHFQVMRILHTLWFLAIPAEVLLLNRPFSWSLGVVAAIALLAGQLLRYAAIRTLGWRWSVRIYTVPGAPRIDHGVYRYVRHPNYLGVVLELAAVPLLHGAWWTAASFTVANGLLLAYRIRQEERALSQAAPASGEAG